jgi:tetratricopeptide (TPR) repeat protein
MKKQRENRVESLYSQAFILRNQGQSQKAYLLCEQVLKIAPKQPETLGLMGIMLAEANRPFDALSFFEKSLQSKKDPSTYNNRGNLYQTLKQYELALEDYETALKINKNFTDAYFNQGNCYKDLNQPAKAIDCYHKAVLSNPKYYTAYTNMGLCYQNLQEFNQALECFNKAIEIEPTYFGAYNNKGFCLHVLMRLDESIEAFKKATELNPDNNDAKFNIGFVYLLKGDLENGWAGHERRWFNKYKPSNLPRLWQGEDLKNKTIYIYHEQGLGDTLQFIRYVQQLKECGSKVIAAVKPEIAELFRNNPYIDEVKTDPKDIPEYDYQCPMMSLPAMFKTRVNNIPYAPYIQADPEKVSHFRQKMGNSSKLRIGVVWSGGYRADQPEIWAVNERRNIPIEKLAQIYTPDVEFYNLQFGAKEYPFPMVDLMGDVKDFSDTAAIIQNLDCIITVDTSTAHLAGAMGKEVWLMNRFDTCWRWLENTDRTDWYPSFKIYRQKEFMNWDNVVADIKRDLDKRATQ